MADIDEIWNTESLFVDKGFLSSNFKPGSLKDIKHRNDIIELYALHLRPTKNNQVPTNLLLYGGSGTGKTLVTQVLLDEIVKRTEHDVMWINVYCENNQTDTKILSTINKALEDKTKTPAPKLPNDIGAFFDWFCKLVDIYGGIIIIFFDEIDKMRNPNLINRFNRIVENRETKRKVCIISAINDMKFTENLETRTKDALCANELYFSPYDIDILEDILVQRAKLAFKPNVLSEMVIPLCASFASTENGSARYALDLLRKAGDSAERRKSSVVIEEDVKVGKMDLETQRYESTLMDLPHHEQIVLLAILYAKQELGVYKTTTGLVYEVYRAMCMEAGTEALTGRRVTDFISDLDTQGLIQATTVNKGRKGRTKEIVPNIDIKYLKILERTNVGDLINFKNITHKYHFEEEDIHPDFKQMNL